MRKSAYEKQGLYERPFPPAYRRASRWLRRTALPRARQRLDWMLSGIGKGLRLVPGVSPLQDARLRRIQRRSAVRQAPK